ncbi:MAG: biotin--[acetyl-CoA-carboxylase] ligase [Desulfobacterales bacterium]
MEPGIYIAGSGRNGLFDGLAPEELAGFHPSWQRDVDRLRPWDKTRLPAAGQFEDRLAAWKSRKGRSDACTLVCGRCTSTMDGLRSLIDVIGMAPWDCLIAVEQQKGRGQMQRSWISPAGNLYASWYWPNPGEINGAAPGWQAMASLMAGELVATVLDSMGVRVCIKWPNDLLIEDRKVCGILVEHRGGHLIVGIGLNLASAPPLEQLTDAFAIKPASLRELDLQVTPLEFWMQMLEIGRSRFYHLVQSMTPAAFVALVKKRLAWQGHTVTIRISRDEAFTAEIVGLAADGGLIIEKNGKTRVIYNGSILPGGNIHL